MESEYSFSIIRPPSSGYLRTV